LADTTLEVINGGLGAIHIRHHQVVVLLDDRLNQLVVVALDIVKHILGHIGDGVVFRKTGVIPDVGFLGENVDNTLEGVFAANGQCHDKRVGAKHSLDLLNNLEEVSADAVKFVDENNPRDF